MPNLGPFELFLIVFAIVLLFGARKLPDLARSLGRSLNEFKKGRDENAKDETDAKKTDSKKADEKKE